MGVGHVSVYGLTVEEGTVLGAMVRRGEVVMPGEEELAGEWEAICRWFGERGFVRYEVSNFALPGEECLHNLRYWRLEPYLGVGPSAVSTLPGKEGPVRVRQVRDVGRFVAEGGVWEEVEVIGPQAFLLEWFMMGLRTREGVEGERFRRVWGVGVEEVLGEVGRRWCGWGWPRWGRAEYGSRSTDSTSLTLSSRISLFSSGKSR